MRLPTLIITVSQILGTVWTTSAAAAESLYTRHVRPLLAERCYACHGALKQEAGLRVDTGALVRKGSDNGPIVNFSVVDESVLLDRLTSENDGYRMPPEGNPFTADEIDHLKKWISTGAASPKNEVPEADPSDHWAFRTPIRPVIPTGSNDSWSRNPIDQFIGKQHDALGLTAAEDASDEHLLRRVTLDLIGTPPTTAQLQNFRDEPTPQHFLQVVDQLLQSPHYGERWARHWMDIWRYSDWYGRRYQNDVRNSAPQIWRWRDWIVDSLNQDKSYARMIQEMLAADEIAADDDSTWAATGYLVRNYYSLNPNEWMRHNVEYTGKAFLGLTFNCAHCHDHKYDPILHDDYFRMRAFFEPIGIRQDRVAGEAEPPPFEVYKYGGSRKAVRTGMVRIFDQQPDAVTWFYTGGDERNRLQERGSIEPGVPEFLKIPLPEIAPIDLPMTGWYPGSRSHIQKAVMNECTEEIEAAETALNKARSQATDAAPLLADLSAAQQEFDAAVQKAVAAGEQGALDGRQSLLLDGLSGRQIVQRELSNLNDLPDGTTIAFRLRILDDSHFNFQLARDTSKSLTALYLGFVQGTIKAYRPGTFSEFVVANYSPTEFSEPLHITLTIHPADDVAKLRILSGTDNLPLVSGVDIALNAWNPSKNPHQPLTFDCRPGTRVLIDDVTVTADDQKWQWDFETPLFADGQNIAGVQGWTVHSLSAAAGTSAVSAIAGCRSATTEYQKLCAVRATVHAATRSVENARLRLDAAKLWADSIRATIAADNAQRDSADEETVAELSRRAWSAQQKSDESTALWQVADAEHQLGLRQSISDPDDSTKKEVADLQSKLAKARTDLKSAREQIASTPTSVEYRRLSPTSSMQSTGRRRALAEWITDPRHPLTPRVAVNHIWLRHFHTPLVESVYDFGRNGKKPTHPELLDWLAVELVENNWSMKHIHRLIVTSRTYQMTTSLRGLDANRDVDEENRSLWRMNPGRMEAEMIRDSVLAIAGTLTHEIGGEVRPNTEALTTYRRSLYYEVYPESGGNNAMAEVFDAPDPGECFRRTSTVMPQQALALSNSQLIHSAGKSTVAAIGVVTEVDDPTFVTQAFRRILSRTPSSEEQMAAIRFLQDQTQQTSSPNTARESLVRVLFNHNDFVTIR